MYVRKTALGLGRKVREAPEEARALIHAALVAAKGNIRGAARDLQCSRLTLYRWVEVLKLKGKLQAARAGGAQPHVSTRR